MTYITREGERFTASDALHLVGQLRRASFVSTKDDASFMRELADRMKLQDRNAVIPTDNVDKFVAALISYGYIEQKDDVRGEDQEQVD